jgi:hypothetical protein
VDKVICVNFAHIVNIIFFVRDGWDVRHDELKIGNLGGPECDLKMEDCKLEVIKSVRGTRSLLETA